MYTVSIHYADDLPVAIASLIECLCGNYLCLNVEKSCFTVITNNYIEALPVLKINNTYLSFSKKTKFLGIPMDNKLLFAKHMSKLYSKVSRNIGLSKKLSIFYP